jgi:hypothetical protein
MTFNLFVPLVKTQIDNLGNFHKNMRLREFSVVM